MPLLTLGTGKQGTGTARGFFAPTSVPDLASFPPDVAPAPPTPTSPPPPPSADPAPPPAAGRRERDIRDAIRDRLTASREFDAVYIGSFAANARPTSDTRAVAIVPNTTVDVSFSDGAMAGDLCYNLHLQIVVAARDQDPWTRDDRAEHLLLVAKNLLGGQSLAGLTNAQMTRIRSWTWSEAKENERQIVAMLYTQYYEDGWDAADVGDP